MTTTPPAQPLEPLWTLADCEKWLSEHGHLGDTRVAIVLASDIVFDYEAERNADTQRLAALTARVQELEAQLERMTKTTVWRPLPDGDYEGQHRNHTITVAGEWLTISEPNIHDGSIDEATLAVHDDVRLCEQVEVDAPTVPDDIAQTIRLALNESAEDIGMNPSCYTEPDVAMARMDAALAWLDSLAKGGDDGDTTG